MLFSAFVSRYRTVNEFGAYLLASAGVKGHNHPIEEVDIERLARKIKEDLAFAELVFGVDFHRKTAHLHGGRSAIDALSEVEDAMRRGGGVSMLVDDNTEER